MVGLVKDAARRRGRSRCAVPWQEADILEALAAQTRECKPCMLQQPTRVRGKRQEETVRNPKEKPALS